MGLEHHMVSLIEFAYLSTTSLLQFFASFLLGSALIRVGQTEQALGELERNYIRGGHDALIAPLGVFLNGEMKNIMRERKILENKRLDLDACKNRVRKARGMQLQPPVSPHRDDLNTVNSEAAN